MLSKEQSAACTRRSACPRRTTAVAPQRCSRVDRADVKIIRYHAVVRLAKLRATPDGDGCYWTT
jgi:hypothetical protein